MPWLVMVGRKSSTPTRAHNSLARRSPACLPATTLPSAWMAKAPGGTTCSLSGCGAASNTRRSIYEPTKLSPRHEIRSAGILTFITDDDRIRALMTAPRIKPTSIFLRSARRPNPRQRLHLSTRNFCSDNRDQFRPRFDAKTLAQEERMLQSAAYILCAYLTGMSD